MKLSRIVLLLSWALVAAACGKTENPGSGEQLDEQYTRLYVNTFARNMMGLYYLWAEEVEEGLDQWRDTVEPISHVKKIRYEDAEGEDIDRWTALYDDFKSFYGSVTGNEKTYGFDFKLYYLDEDGTALCAVVTYTYSGSPAQKAGLKRGDVIVKVNGKGIAYENYSDIVYNELLDGTTLQAELGDGSTITMEAVEMYENPVLMSKVFDCDGKKVGYLHFTSFTMDARTDLVAAAKELKAAGVSELILDLRYNGGGFVRTEEVLASLLAPESVVQAGQVLSTEVYNKELTAYYESKKIDTKTYFTTEFTLNEGSEKLSTADANIGIDKLYAIVSDGTASASEALLCELYPYMPITLVGQQTHGKFCSGIMLEGPEFYDDYASQLGTSTAEKGKRYTDNWGLYVMFSRFADKDGETRCMPDGLTPEPDNEVKDDPLDGYQLGDPQETMLAMALKRCGYSVKAPSALKRHPARPDCQPVEGIDPFQTEFGMRIILP